ncbi:Uncharacterised protein [Bordetella ansorpii]|jgi:hypothetical protein|uniref:Uncharacterized protein n=1 Tax=Bordetella ansorpii TaxID=288768 RepID=A0A157ME24_9BORD|nr:hypothetical protein [Bordetella ansorpii]SAI06934.1 Uncharacterised protein [Bordetella ansorpii]
MNPFMDLDLSSSRHEAGRPNVGPSDSSDSASDLPPGMDSDSDAQGTGERDSVNQRHSGRPSDVAPDEIVDEDQAGVSHSVPDPVRNGGTPD